MNPKPTTVKAFLMAPDGGNAEIRRFVMPYEAHHSGGGSPYKFSTFTDKITSAFPSLAGKTFTLTWKDEEGDDIVMSTDEELLQAFEFIKTRCDLLKVYIHCSCSPDHDPRQEHRQRGKKSSEPKTNTGEKPLHPGVICDGCDGQIRGSRYKCLECDDYDLCETCMARDQHPAHNLIRIVDPSREREEIALPPRFWMKFQRSKPWPKKYRKKFEKKHPFAWNRHGRKPWKNLFGPHMRRFSGGPFPHGHHFQTHFGGHCKRSETDRPAGADRPSSADADQFMAAREQSAEFLRYVGQTVAAFLDPLGIDVSVDVEHGQQQPEGSKKDQPKNTQGATAASDVEMSTPQEVDLTSPPASPSQQQETASSAKQPSPAPSAKDSETGDGDWTMVAEALASASVSQTETRTAMETEEPAVPTPSEPVHPIPKIAEAVERMLSMGFSNDGGWLSRLVEAKEGNIGAVLDTLHPLHQQGRNPQQ